MYLINLVLSVQCAGLDIYWRQLNTCATNDYGDELEIEMGNKTYQLDPKMTYVPWITLDGFHDQRIQTLGEKNLKQLVCESYKGVKPKECSSSLSSEGVSSRANSIIDHLMFYSSIQLIIAMFVVILFL